MLVKHGLKLLKLGPQRLVMNGDDYALRVQASRVWIQTSVQRSRLLGLYQQEGATDNAPQDFLEFLDDFWERRRLGEGMPIIDIVPHPASTGGRPPLARRPESGARRHDDPPGLHSRMFGFCTLCTLICSS